MDLSCYALFYLLILKDFEWLCLLSLTCISLLSKNDIIFISNLVKYLLSSLDILLFSFIGGSILSVDLTSSSLAVKDAFVFNFLWVFKSWLLLNRLKCFTFLVHYAPISAIAFIIFLFNINTSLYLANFSSANSYIKWNWLFR